MFYLNDDAFEQNFRPNFRTASIPLLFLIPPVLLFVLIVSAPVVVVVMVVVVVEVVCVCVYVFLSPDENLL